MTDEQRIAEWLGWDSSAGIFFKNPLDRYYPDRFKDYLFSDSGQIAIINQFIKDGFYIGNWKLNKYGIITFSILSEHSFYSSHKPSLSEAILDCAVKYLNKE